MKIQLMKNLAIQLIKNLAIKDNFHLCCPKTNFGRNSLTFKGAVLYNNLPPGIRHLRNHRHACAAHLFSNCN